jgi:5-formyltetrahydrofolate cyclo-ligase
MDVSAISPPDALPGGDDKATWRRRLAGHRAAASGTRRQESEAARTRMVLALPEVAGARTVAAYVSMPTEPDTSDLIRTLTERGVQVLLPVLLPDRDLDWGVAGALAAGPGTLQEPVGPHLGVDAIGTADVVLCPGLAADQAGTRLGRGGGSYDRALARTRADALRVVLLYEGELVDRLPADPHDQPVHLAITPVRAVRLG